MIFFKIFTKYSTHHSLSANTGFKSLAFILFEILHLQNCAVKFQRAVILQGEIIQKKKKNTCMLFFDEESIHEVSRRYLIPEYHRCKISGSKILKKGNNSKNII